MHSHRFRVYRFVCWQGIWLVIRLLRVTAVSILLTLRVKLLSFLLEEEEK